MKGPAFLIALILLAGCASKPIFNEEAVKGADQQPLDSDLRRLQPGDLIGMHVLVGTNEMSLEGTLDKQGWVDLPPVGRFHLTGMSELEVEGTLRDACRAKGILPLGRPREKTRFYEVLGQVKGPGRQAYIGRITLTRAVESAGGLTAAAKLSKVLIRRSDGSIEQCDYRRIVNSQAADPEVRPGDVVEVKRKFSWLD